jgi:hypothetical protein
MALPTEEKTLLAFDPIRRIVPTARTSQHDRVFGDVLSVVSQQPVQSMPHLYPRSTGDLGSLYLSRSKERT